MKTRGQIWRSLILKWLGYALFIIIGALVSMALIWLFFAAMYAVGYWGSKLFLSGPAGNILNGLFVPTANVNEAFGQLATAIIPTILFIIYVIFKIVKAYKTEKHR